MELGFRLKKSCCKILSFDYNAGKWYKLELIYGKRYYRFFALSFQQLERESLRFMRRRNRKFDVKRMTKGEVSCLQNP